jgi:hypothetical protein
MQRVRQKRVIASFLTLWQLIICPVLLETVGSFAIKHYFTNKLSLFKSFQYFVTSINLKKLELQSFKYFIFKNTLELEVRRWTNVDFERLFTFDGKLFISHPPLAIFLHLL